MALRISKQSQRGSADNPGVALTRRGLGRSRAVRRDQLRQVDALQAGLRKATRLEGVAPAGREWSWGVARGGQEARRPGGQAEEKQQTSKVGLSERGKETETKGVASEAKVLAFEKAPPSEGVWPGAEEQIGGCQ